MSLFDELPGADPISGVVPSYPDVDPPSCQLLGPTALIVQGLMGIFVILSLVYKRQRETPKRPWRIWLFDVSKQIIGQMFVHGVNLLASDLVSDHTSGNACVSYFLNILIDTTFGVAVIYFTLHGLTNIFTNRLHLKGFESGVYGTPPAFAFWIRQAAIYILSLTVMKTIVILILFIFPGIYVAGEWLLSWTATGDGDAVQVIFVMGIFPIIMNVLQFWLIDSIVKASVIAGVALDIENDGGSYQDREPLFQAPSEEGDDDDAPPVKKDSRKSRRSISSLDSMDFESRDQSSFNTSMASSQERHKSSASSSKAAPAELHEYPPSMTSSFTSDAPAKAPREAKNLLKKPKRRDAPTPLTTRSPTPHSPRIRSPAPSSVPATPSPGPALTPRVVSQHDQSDWADSWGDSHDWEVSETLNKQKPFGTPGEWNSSNTTIRQGS